MAKMNPDGVENFAHQIGLTSPSIPEKRGKLSPTESEQGNMKVCQVDNLLGLLEGFPMDLLHLA